MGLSRSEPEPHSIEQLVVRARGGDTGAFTELVARHQRALLGYLAHLAPADAEDLAQEAFLTAHARLADLAEPRAFPGWLFAIARNAALSARKKARRDPHGAPPTPAPVLDQIEERSRAELLAGCLAALDPENRELLLLRYFVGWDTDAIAALVGSTPDRTRAKLQYARKLMRDELSKRGGW